MACFASQNPTYLPAMRLISAITNASPAAVTTTFTHNYITGEIVRLVIPSTYGMVQANKLKGKITVTGATTFTIDIDTTVFDSFIVPASPSRCAQVVPLGEDSSILTAATRNILT